MFREKQKFSAGRFMLILSILLAAALVLALYLISTATADNWFEAFLPFLILLSVTLLLRKTALQVEIDDQSIRYRVYPFPLKWRTIDRAAIREIAVVSFDPVGDYGGWGIRFSGKGKAIIMGGHWGMRIRLSSGKNLMIGTQRPEDVFSFLAENGYSPQRLSPH